LVVALGPACGPSVDLSKLEVADIFSGYYDFGVVPDGPYKGQNKLVPSVSFKLKNNGVTPVDHVALTVSFWQAGADGENDSKEISGIGAAEVQPGATSETLLVRSSVGYTTPAARSELFDHSEFRDFVVKFFAKRSGKIVPIGEVTVDRRLIPQSTSSR
jgi:hypothetical protein